LDVLDKAAAVVRDGVDFERRTNGGTREQTEQGGAGDDVKIHRVVVFANDSFTRR
jgi:hypothetical protein